MSSNLYPRLTIPSGQRYTLQYLTNVLFASSEWTKANSGGGLMNRSGVSENDGNTPLSQVHRTLMSFYPAGSISTSSNTKYFWVSYVAKSTTTFELIRWVSGDTKETESPYTVISYSVKNDFGVFSIPASGKLELTDTITGTDGKSNGSINYEFQLASNVFECDSGAVASATLTRYYHGASEVGGAAEGTTTIANGSSQTLYWVHTYHLSFRIEATAASGAVAIGLTKNGVLIAKGRERLSVGVGTFSDGDVFRIVKLSAADVCLPIFGDIQDANHRPLFADIAQTTHLPLFAMLVGNIMTYIQGHSSHLWTRITLTSSPSGDAVSDDVFPGRDTSRYDGSSSTKQTAVSVSLSELAALATASSSGDLVVTLYFHCALCNWGCMGDIEEYEVDFVVFWKHFAMTVKKSTASNPGPGSEYFAFSFTVTLSEQNGAYYVKEVAITTKDGATY